MDQIQKPVVLVERHRLNSGLWGYPQGDISASYSADRFAEGAPIRTPFVHGAFNFVSMGGGFSGFDVCEATAYPLLPVARGGKLPPEPDPEAQWGYAGRAAKHLGVQYVFGEASVFRGRPMTETQVLDRTRRMYGYGGLFAAEAGTYNRLVEDFINRASDETTREFLRAELDRNDLPQSREAMREWIETNVGKSEQGNPDQLTLF